MREKEKSILEDRPEICRDAAAPNTSVDDEDDAPDTEMRVI